MSDSYNQIRLGVLSLQGGFHKHIQMIQKIGALAFPVKEPKDLVDLHGLLLPGGESTTIGMLMQRFGLLDELPAKIAAGFPVFGTCAGAILLSDTIENSDQIRIGGLPVQTRRNAYGRQVESFEADLDIRGVTDGQPSLRGVFIRAPQFLHCSKTVEILCRHEGLPVVVQKDSLLAATFHPELTQDDRLHRYFIEKIIQPKNR